MGGIKDGILVLDINTSEDGKRTIISKEKKVFDSNDTDTYMEKFRKYHIEGIIENQHYTDNTWIIAQQGSEYKNRCNADFEFEIIPNVNKVLKFYCLDMITNKISSFTIHTTIKKITEALIESNIFNIEYYEDFEDYIYNLTPDVRMRLRDSLWGFFSYYQNKVPEQYISLLSCISNAERNPRILPDYRSILCFGYYMDEFIKKAKKELILKYCPVILWWRITSCIPIRVIEFTLIKKLGCYKDENTGECYLVVTRAKPHSYREKALNERKEQTFKITEEIYNMAHEYMELEGHIGEYLLSYNLYKINFSQRKKMGNYDFLPSWNLKQMLYEFYDEIIYGMFQFNSVHKFDVVDSETRIVERTTGNNMVRLQLGDTRHLAIINLVLLGRNPYTIKELAGHNNINSFEHYAYHMEKYVESKTILLAEDIRQQLYNLSNGKHAIKIGNRRNERLQQLIINNLYKNKDIIKLKDGVCILYQDKIEFFPNLCLCDCSKCEGFIRDMEQLSNEELSEELQVIKDNIDLQLEVIRFYYLHSTKEKLINKEANELNMHSQRTLKTSVNRLNSLINQRAITEAYKLKVNEIEYNEWV